MAASEEELMISSSRILHFDECLSIFQIFYSGKYIPFQDGNIHEQFIFAIMTQEAGKETIFNSLSKLIELKFISTT